MSNGKVESSMFRQDDCWEDDFENASLVWSRLHSMGSTGFLLNEDLGGRLLKDLRSVFVRPQVGKESKCGVAIVTAH